MHGGATSIEHRLRYHTHALIAIEQYVYPPQFGKPSLVHAFGIGYRQYLPT